MEWKFEMVSIYGTSNFYDVLLKSRALKSIGWFLNIFDLWGIKTNTKGILILNTQNPDTSEKQTS